MSPIFVGSGRGTPAVGRERPLRLAANIQRDAGVHHYRPRGKSQGRDRQQSVHQHRGGRVDGQRQREAPRHRRALRHVGMRHEDRLHGLCEGKLPDELSSRRHAS